MCVCLSSSCPHGLTHTHTPTHTQVDGNHKAHLPYDGAVFEQHETQQHLAGVERVGCFDPIRLLDGTTRLAGEQLLPADVRPSVELRVRERIFKMEDCHDRPTPTDVARTCSDVYQFGANKTFDVADLALPYVCGARTRVDTRDIATTKRTGMS